MHGLWQTNIPSRFLDELPEAHVEVAEVGSGRGFGGYGGSRFANMDTFGSTYYDAGLAARAAPQCRGAKRGEGRYKGRGLA